MVKTQEKTEYGEVMCRARNPLPVKTMMQILGMPAGPCRQPMGMMTKNGIDIVLAALRQVYKNSPEILQPVAEAFDVNIEERLSNSKNWENLNYPAYTG